MHRHEVEVDHRIPHRGDPRLRDAVENFQVVCKACHGQKNSSRNRLYSSLPMIRTCLVCSVGFKARVNGAGTRQTCCSKVCAGKYSAANNTKRAHALKAFRDKSQAEAERKRAERHEARAINCCVCGKRYYRHSAKRPGSVCSYACRLKALNARRAAGRPQRPKMVCCGCAQTYQPVGRQRLFCSPRCARKNARRIEKGIRRARTRRVPYDAVSPVKVFIRDHWTCQLCGARTPKQHKGLMVPNAPELDHIIPLSLGGEHTYANVQCACRQCNGLKGNKVIGQLRLSLYSATLTGGE